MVQLPSSEKNNSLQKVFAWVLLGAAIWGGIKLFNAFSDDLIHLFKNIWIMIGIGAPLVYGAFYIATNPLVVWGFFNTLSWNLTKWLIKRDPLSVMDRYADYLAKKLKGLNVTKVELQGKRIKLERLIKKLQDSIKENLQKGTAALKQDQKEIASLAGTKVATDKQTLVLYNPIYTKMIANLKFLDELSENWQYSIEKLRYTIDRKREEYESLREMAKALDQATEFAKGDTDASRLYNESIKQLEIKVSHNIAKIEEFEKNSKSILGSIKVEKQMIQDEGLAALEDYRNNGDLFLPDFSVGTLNTNGIQDIQYEEVKNNGQQAPKFKFLNK